MFEYGQLIYLNHPRHTIKVAMIISSPQRTNDQDWRYQVIWRGTDRRLCTSDVYRSEFTPMNSKMFPAMADKVLLAYHSQIY